MTHQPSTDSIAIVTAQEVLPEFGLAFVTDDMNNTWGITRAADGPGLQTLSRGVRLQVALERHDGFSLVRSYRPLN